MFKARKSVLVLVVLVVVAALLAACGGDDKKSGSSSVDLKQSFDSGTGVSVKYPDGWIAKDAAGDTVYVANSQATVDAMEASTAQGPDKGQTGVILMGISADQLSGMSAEDTFKMMVQSMGGEGSDTTLSDVKDVKVNGKTAYRTDITSTTGDGFYIGWESDGSLVIAAGVAASGELKDHESTLLKIIDSVTYTPPAG